MIWLASAAACTSDRFFKAIRAAIKASSRLLTEIGGNPSCMKAIMVSRVAGSVMAAIKTFDQLQLAFLQFFH